MASPRFVHLRIHSEFSITDGVVRIDDAVATAVKDEMGALALTDLSNLFGLVRFYTAARSGGIKPIAGADVWVSNPQDPDQPHRLLLLVQNHSGYLNLCQLLSKASLDNQSRGRAEVDLAWFSEPAAKAEDKAAKRTMAYGLIALSAARNGEVGAALLADQEDMAKAAALRLEKLFPKSFYIEIQRGGHPQDEKHLQLACHLASELKLPVVATHPVQFMQRSDFIAHEARVCIAEGELLGNPRRQKKFNDEQYFLTQEEMEKRFADLPAAIANSVEIAKRCNLSLVLGQPRLPDFPTPPGITLDDYLLQQSEVGLERHMEKNFPDPEERAKEMSRYHDRLVFEVKTISQMGFPGYFLIVADFINWAKNNGVPVGPGRGSGAGSLVAYSLGITDLDPLRYNLLFERFLNPERVSMPDFDIDFCQHGRDRVIQYVKDKYGKDAVSQIATFGTMAARAAIRDVGRVLEQGYNFVDGIAKLVPNKPGQYMTIEMAKKEEKQLAEREKNEDEVRQLLSLAQQLEGMTRNVGMHAGGVLIAPGRLTDFCPLYTQESKDQDSSSVISQFDKDDVEAIGLVKFDFLGLTTLTILAAAERWIKALHADRKDWDIGEIPLDDEKAFDVLKKANTVAVFQLESRGMQGMLREAKPDRFEDIIALVALYRPGPMDLIPDFIERKHGRQKVEYPDPRIEPVLRETYGIMVYQEQVMQMAQMIGGYSLGGADMLRRAMGKKKPEEMAQHRKIFSDGAKAGGISEAKANEIYDLMERFAGYGFNKSHAAAYALLAYQTAWLKAYYPAEFMAANLSLAMDDTDKVKILYDDCLVNQIRVFSPDINTGVYEFTPLRAPDATPDSPISHIRYGLGAVRGTGEAAIESIVKAREADGPFKDLFDFCARVDRRQVNRRAIEALMRAGAFDSLYRDSVPAGGNLYDIRSTLLASLARAIEAAEQAEASIHQVSLFEVAGEEHRHLPELVREPIWSEKKRLQEEKASLGLCLTGHMFDAYRDETAHFIRQPLSKLVEGKDQLVAGIITSARMLTGQRGRMMIATIDDGTAAVEVTLYSEVYEPNRSWLKEDELLIAKVNVSPDKFSGGMRIVSEAVMDITGARMRFARNIHVCLDPAIDIRMLRSQIGPYLMANRARDPRQGAPFATPGSNEGVKGLMLTAAVTTSGGACLMQFPEEMRIYPDDACLHSLHQLLASKQSNAVEVQYH
ncbi:DNA polymerase III subunit alpha [Polynucleobacter asymbioticus]|uniref:DNA polymerase III subunit alpha n=1 Tax=Polynucleobacter asymbioticus (strain DSM 18221 / CIP 109841 / QLW-P1DMWA-1) TaxID=312153 RepID=A4SWG0_POLAQ|nr:DNA polymerase III subunit alpha [Polynucleobacter asymbioticus]ABP33824.1 DNA polymerase III, alpha subunit [Polynucleobacter asymbioticus QLW-P1DMWA-1]APC05694.1 DNA polymerase III subunit alpha [Polynucleobacter asymbioticus]